MGRLSVGDVAPDFALPNHAETLVRLSDVLQQHNALLLFNLGFIWLHCRNHVAQLRHEYEQFRVANTEILVMAPNRPASLARYVSAHPTPFPILSDSGAGVAVSYGIEAIHAPFLTVFIGAMFVVDRAQRIRYADYAVPLVSRPDDSKPLAALAGIA